MLRRFRMRTKVAVLLAPFVLAVLAAVLGAGAGADRRAAEQSASAAVAAVVARPGGMASAVAAERAATVEYLVSGTRDRRALDAARSTTDAALRDLDGLVPEGPAGPAVSAARVKVVQLTEVRRAVDAATAEPMVVWAAIGDVVGALDALAPTLARQLPPGDQRDGLVAAIAAREVVDAFDRAAVLGAVALARGDFLDAAHRSALAAAVEAVPVSFDRFRSLADPATASAAAALAAGPEVRDVVAAGRSLVATPAPLAGDGAGWRSSNEALAARVVAELWQPQLGRIDAAAAAAGAEARRTVLLALAAGIAVVALGVGLSVLGGRALTSPLRALVGAADEVADERLPATVRFLLDEARSGEPRPAVASPITVTGHDETADVARAVERVYRTAVALVSEQVVERRNAVEAAGDLGARVHALVERQLEELTELEMRERDPDVLADLFRLDHLATRARRVAEALFVVTGRPSPRVWDQPVPFADVLRAAAAEVGEYARVRLGPVDPIEVSGHAAADLTHALAELIDHALSQSPPHLPVEVSAGERAGKVVVEIVDHGPPLSELELARANRRLAGQEAASVAPSQYLGMYVAGRWCQELGLDARLGPAPSGGTVIEVVVPHSLFDRRAGARLGPATTGPDRTEQVLGRATRFGTPAAPVEAVPAAPNERPTPEPLPGRRRAGGRAAARADDDPAPRVVAARDAVDVQGRLAELWSGVERGRGARPAPSDADRAAVHPSAADPATPGPGTPAAPPWTAPTGAPRG